MERVGRNSGLDLILLMMIKCVNYSYINSLLSMYSGNRLSDPDPGFFSP